MKDLFHRIIFGLLVSVFLLSGCSFLGYLNNTEISKRPLSLTLDGRWIGNGISYSPYRDGESPDKNSLTSKADILQDLLLIQKNWNLIRLYATGAQSLRVLEVIQQHQLPIRVMQGAWISGHQTTQQNNQQIDQLIMLANQFPEIIVAVNVGNEIFVDWSWHKVNEVNGMDEVIGYIRKVRSKIIQPVTVNDDYNFWNKPHAQKIVNEIDFIGLHAYAFWNNRRLSDAIGWTDEIYFSIQALYPEYTIALTESGWPTSRVYDDSYEGGLVGKAGENEQAVFFDQYNHWIEKNKIISFYFEAFDEQWKGGFDGVNPLDKAEKHWGLYRSDRSPKQAVD